MKHSYLSHTPYTPPLYSDIGEYLMTGTTQGMYETSVANFHALKGMEVSAIAYASDGLKVTGIEVVPSDIAAGETMPLMIYNRGGSGNYGVLSPGQISVLMAPFVKQMRLGVLASNYRGNGGSEGAEEFGGSDVADVLNLIALGREQPWWDGKNIFMLGWSRGGMMAYLALKAGADLTAVAIGAGVADANDKVRGDMEKLMVRVLPNYPEGREALLQARSAICWPEKLNAPLLIMHGDADETVPVSEARALVSKLQALGKTVKYVEYPEGNHALKKHWKEWVSETVEWFQKYKR
jgi:dipeptidyl aminopeptidase/acylaminoacyl peptidase